MAKDTREKKKAGEEMLDPAQKVGKADNNNSDSSEKPKKTAVPSILKFVAEGGDTTVTAKWAVSNFSTDYSLILD